MPRRGGRTVYSWSIGIVDSVLFICWAIAVPLYRLGVAVVEISFLIFNLVRYQYKMLDFLRLQNY